VGIESSPKLRFGNVQAPVSGACFFLHSGKMSSAGTERERFLLYLRVEQKKTRLPE
jgi:hypothetical protein